MVQGARNWTSIAYNADNHVILLHGARRTLGDSALFVLVNWAALQIFSKIVDESCQDDWDQAS
jgi:hypothetical protein